MGSLIEFNDTLKLTFIEGFPSGLNLKEHRRKHIKLEDIADKGFRFNKEGPKVYHVAPIRVFLVQDINRKWLYWGHAVITEQTIMGNETSGKFKITKLYDPEYQKQVTKNESPKGKSYF